MASLNNKGLSLIGALLAVFLLATTAVAVSQLVARTQRASSGSRESLVAVMLAREGLELVRALRDTNWFLAASDNRLWTQGICENQQFTIDADRVRQLNPVGDFANDQLFITDHGEWVHEEIDRQTSFHRIMTLDCSDQDVSLLVKSTVAWIGNNNQERSLTLSERLYDWLP